MIKRILVPTDGSHESDRALAIASQFAAALKADVSVVQVVPYPSFTEGLEQISADSYQELLDLLTEDAKANVARVVKTLEDAGVRATGTVMHGSPAFSLLEAESAEHPDLVIIASHGRSGIARFALGSVADRLVREGTAPVLVVRRESQTKAVSTALVLLDGSQTAEVVLPLLESLAGQPIQSATLLRVVSDSDEERAAASYLEQFSRRLVAAGIKTSITVRTGDPSLVAEAEADAVDLVVAATHGRGGFNRFRHGSVADRLVRETHTPILLVRAENRA